MSGGYPSFRAGGTIGAPALVRRPATSLLRGRAGPLAKLADADEAGIIVGQRQRKSPVTAPRFGGSQWPPPRPSRQRRRVGKSERFRKVGCGKA